MDIYLLTDSLASDEAAQKVRDANAQYSVAPKVKNVVESHTEHKQIFYDEIKSALSGYARIIKYTNDTVNQYVRNEHHSDVGTSKRVVFENKP